MKVALVIETSGGGSGRHVIDLADGLIRLGAEVHVVYSRLRKESAGFVTELENLPGVRVQPLDMRRSPHISDIGAIRRLRAYIESNGGFDVLHGHSSKAGAVARFAAIGTKIGAVIYTPHAFRTMDPYLGKFERLVYGSIERVLGNFLTDLLIAVSEDERQHAISLGIRAEVIRTILNGVALPRRIERGLARDSLGIGDDEVCVGFVGRFVEQKAPELLIDAFGAVAADFPKSKVVMVGSGELEGSIRARISRHHLERRVTILTGLKGQDVMPAFDVLVMPSRYEAMPYVLLEAVSFGVPIIVTEVGGASTVVHDGENGFVVRRDDPAAIAEKLRILIESIETRERMRRAALQIREQFSLDAMISRTVDAYESALRAPQRRVGAIAAVQGCCVHGH